MPSSNNDVGLSFVLSQLQENLSRQDDRLAEHMKATASQGAMLESVSAKVENLVKTVSTGNGQPALLVQVNDLRHDIATLKSSITNVDATVASMARDVKALTAQLNEKYTPAQKAERWKAIGILATAATSLLTSVAAILGFHL